MPPDPYRLLPRVLLILLACSPGRGAPASPASGRPPSEAGLISSPDSVTQEFAIDLDADGLPDTLRFHHVKSIQDPGVFDTLTLQLTRSGTHFFSGPWDPPDSLDWPLYVGNRVPSKALYVGRFPQVGFLIFLFGPSYGCCLQSLDIIRVTPDGASRYFHSDAFSLIDTLTSHPPEAASLAGVFTLSEVVGTTAPGALTGTTYNPTVVVRLGQVAAIDTAASAAATRARLGGFAGLDGNDSILAIERKDRSRYLWDERSHQRVP